MAKRGRPTKQAEPGAKASLGLKVTPAIKTRLEEAAAASGRTQSQEAEFRIERSFDRQDLLSEVLIASFGRRQAGYIQLMLRAYADAGTVAGRLVDPFGTEIKNWTESKWAMQQAMAALNEAVRWTIEVDEYDDPEDSATPPLAIKHDMETPGLTIGKAVGEAARGFATADGHYAELGKTVRPLIDFPEFLAKKLTESYEKKLAEGLREEAQKAKRSKK